MQKKKLESTKQIRFWASKKGLEYTMRQPRLAGDDSQHHLAEYGLSRLEMNRRFLGKLSRKAKILEVGANIGLQLELLRRLGFHKLYGIELNNRIVKLAKRIHPRVHIIQGSALDLPFKNNAFDLVYTSGVLIHIAPQDLTQVMNEICRVSKNYIWGFEYYAPSLTEVVYRGRRNLLWKGNYANLYRRHCSGLQLMKEQKFRSVGTKNISRMFLLKKQK